MFICIRVITIMERGIMTLKVRVRKVVATGITLMLIFAGILVIFTNFTQLGGADAPFTSSVEVSDDLTSELQINSDIAVDSSGNLYAVWEDLENGVDKDIYFADSSDGGQNWRKPNILVNSSSDDQTKPSIAVNPSTSDIYVAWQDKRGGDWNISFANSLDGGTTWSNPPVQINDDVGAERQGAPDITVDSVGTIHAVWDDFRNLDWDIYYSKSIDGGFTWAPNVKVTNSVGNQRFPSIDVDPSGTIVVAWDHEVSIVDHDIYCANSTDGGLIFGVNIRVDDDVGGALSEYPSLAVDSSGVIYVVWGDWRGVGGDIYFSKSVNLGDGFSANVPVNDDLTNNQVSPEIAVGGGILYVVWEDGRNGDLDIYFSNSTNGGANWGANIKVNDIGTNNQQQPAIVLGPAQTVHVIWDDDKNGDKDIYSASIETPGVPPTVDRIFISTTPDGSSLWLSSGSYMISETDILYCVGWNNSLNQFAGLVPADWSVDNGIVGDVTPAVSSDSTTFSAIGPGTCKVTAFNTPYPSNETGPLTVSTEGIDRIIISQTPDLSSGWIGDQYYTVTDVDTFYACGWNDTNSQFVDLVDVTWFTSDALVGDITPLPTSTTFTAKGDGTCFVTATSGLYGSNETGVLTVTSDVVDRIFISLSDDGSLDWFGDQIYPEGDTVTLYSCGWNDTSNVFVKLVDAKWISDNTAVGGVSPDNGKSTSFSALSAGTCKVTANNLNYTLNSTGILTVFALEIDSIIISRSSDGTGGGVEDKTYSVEEIDIFYALGWNSTYNQFVNQVTATWTSSEPLVGSVDALGLWTNFSALKVTGDSTCFITAEYTGITGSTGTLTVLAPKVDELIIRDAPNNGGSALDTATFSINDLGTYYVAGYNDTAGYIGDISDAAWSVSGGIGTVDPALGNSTTFTATSAGSGKIMVTYNGILGESGTLTVEDVINNNIPPSKPGQPTLTVIGKEKIEITWSANSESNIKNYIVQRSDSPDGPWTNFTLSNDTLSYSDSGLKSDTTYYYRVIAVNDNDLASDPSDSVSATTQKGEVTDGDDFPWVLVILLIVIILVVLFLFLFFFKKKNES
jgi:hypothetical protein